jgi:hypothetical protein
MGLDQYAYVAAKAGAYGEYWGDENYNKEDSDPTKFPKPHEMAYWRKHPNLQGWMKQLWEEKNPGVLEDDRNSFNGVELELTWQDLERLEADVLAGNLPQTKGFFFGDSSDELYKQDDLDFIKAAKAELFMGLRVFYNSSW